MKRLALIAWGLVALACEATAAQPRADFSATPTSGCAPLDVQFTDQSTGDGIVTWLWTFGDGDQSIAQNPLHRYKVPAAYPATYSVTLEVNAGLPDHNDITKTGYISLIAPPRAAFSASTSCGCDPLTVQFTDQSTGVGISSWAWKFGDGGTSAEQNPSYEYTDPGTYTVELTVTGTCGPSVATSTTPITVVAPPTVDFSGTPATGCAPLKVDFTHVPAGGGITATLWEFGDGGTSANPSTSHTYQNAGTYTVKLTLSRGCCSKTTTKTAYITALAPPVADFEADSVSGCPPHTVNFTNQSSDTVTGLQWDFGDGSPPGTGDTPTHLYENSGQYTVVLSGVGPCGPVSKTRNNYITVGTPPLADFTPSVTSGCVGLSVIFTDKSTGTGLTAWTWDFGDGTPLDTRRSPRHTFGNAGTFTVTLTVQGACGTSQKQAAIQVLAPVIADFTSNAPAGLTSSPPAGCGPLEVHFTDQSTGEAITSWAWDFGDGTKSTEQSPIHVYQPPATDASKTYTVKLTAQNSCSSDTETKTAHVTVYAPPVADFTATPVTGCSPLTVRFTDKSKGYALSSRAWDFGDGETSAEVSPFHVYQNAGTFTVKLTLQGLCGENVATKADFVTVLTLPATPASIEYDPIPAYLDDNVTVRWPASAGADTYTVERTPAAKVQWVKVCEVKVAADVPEPSYSCSIPLTQTGSFKFRVVAKNVCGSSPPLEGPPLEVLPPAYFAHWPLDDCKAEDVEKGHDGTLVGTVGCGSDRFGTKSTALQFRGNGVVSGDSLPPWTGDFSLSAWVKPLKAPEGSAPSEGIFLEIFPGAGAGVNAVPIRFLWSETTSTLVVTHADAQSPIKTFEDVASDAWHFILVSRAVAALSVYLDGILVTLPTDAFELGSGFVFGGSAAGGSQFQGDMDDVYYESRARSATEALDLMLRTTGSVYLDPSLASREFTAEPGDSFEALQLKLRTGTARAGGSPFKLDGLTLLVEDLTPQDGAGVAADASFDFLEEVVLYLKASCTDENPQVTKMGSFRIASESPAGARLELVPEGIPASFANRTQVCMVVDAKIWGRAIPSDRIIRFVVKSPDDLEIVDSGGKAFIAGKRLVAGSGAEGNKITVMNFPPEIIGSVPPPPATQRVVGEILGATLHEMSLQAGATENILLDGITYHAVPKTTLDGLTNPVLYLVTGPDAMEQIATGVVDTKSKEIRFEGLGKEITSQGPTDLVLKADISVLPPEAGTAFVLPPAGGPPAFSPLAAGIALASLQLLCILVFLQYARARRLCLKPARVVAFWLFSSLAIIAHGCGPAAIGVGVTAALVSGGGGGGGSGGAFLFQVGILEDDDLKGKGTTTGVLVTPAEGTLPLVGPAYDVRKK